MKNLEQKVGAVLAELRAGRFVVVSDHEDREDEGDLIAAAELVSPELVNFAITHGRGLLCQAINEEMAQRLNLYAMAKNNTALHNTPFTVSVDANNGGSGISAFDRAETIKILGNSASKASELVRPGHIFPLLAHPDGLLAREGHTEAVIDLMKLAGLNPSGILCEILANDGTMLRGKGLDEFCEQHHLLRISIEELIRYRREVLGHCPQRSRSYKDAVRLELGSQVELPTCWGTFQVCPIEDARDMAAEHLCIWKGDLASFGQADEKGHAPILRIHSECLTGEVLYSQRCDCRMQLDNSLQKIEEEGRGMVIYLRQEGRGIGLKNKLRAYHLQQNQSLDTVEANLHLGFDDDLRDYHVATGLLEQLGISEVRLLTNNPNKMEALKSSLLKVTRLPLQVGANSHNLDYLKTKRDKSGHLFDL